MEKVHSTLVEPYMQVKWDLTMFHMIVLKIYYAVGYFDTGMLHGEGILEKVSGETLVGIL